MNRDLSVYRDVLSISLFLKCFQVFSLCVETGLPSTYRFLVTAPDQRMTKFCKNEDILVETFEE